MDVTGSLFVLIPMNEDANQIAHNPRNKDWVIRHPRRPELLIIAIDLKPLELLRRPGFLVTFGRDPTLCDIVLTDRHASRQQCHMFLNRISGEVVLVDTSKGYNTVIDARYAKYDLSKGCRQRALPADLKLRLRLRIVNAEFKLDWNPSVTHKTSALYIEKLAFANRDIPSHALSTPVSPGSDEEGSLQTFNHVKFATARVPDQVARRRTIQYHKCQFLGKGSFGAAYKVVDLDTGDHLALKWVDLTKTSYKSQLKELIRREVEMQAKLVHKTIAAFRHSQAWESDDKIEIFLDLYDGSLEGLIINTPSSRNKCPAYLDQMVSQILQAIAYLHDLDIIHRDIKPANILHRAGNYYLSDFGSSKHIYTASFTNAGTPVFMAPEVYHGEKQTAKLDMYSFGITCLLCIYKDHYIAMSDMELEVLYKEIDKAVRSRSVSELADILELDPTRRWSARQCLSRWFSLEPETAIPPFNEGDDQHPISVSIFGHDAIDAPITPP